MTARTMLCCIAALAAAPARAFGATVVPHPRPPGDPSPSARRSEQTPGYRAVTVDGRNVDLCRTLRGAYCHFSYATSQTVTVEVRTDEPITSHRISPRRFGIRAAAEGNTLRFRITGRKYLEVGINENGGTRTPLYVIADPLEIDPPAPGDADVVSIAEFGADATGRRHCTDAVNRAVAAVSGDPAKRVLYFPPGRYAAGTVHLASGVTLYLAPGSVLQAHPDTALIGRTPPGPHKRRVFIEAHDAQDVAIRGRGVIDGNGMALYGLKWPGHPPQDGAPAEVTVGLVLARCRRAVVEGVIFREPHRWTTYFYACDGLRVSGLKVFGLRRVNDDACDIDSCAGGVVEDCLFVVTDDAVCFKNCGPLSPDGKTGSSRDFVVRRNVIRTACAALKYGQRESYRSDNANVRFEDNDVIAARSGVQFAQLRDGLIHHVTFKGNHYEQCGRAYLLSNPRNHHIRFIDEVVCALTRQPSVVKARDVEFHNLTVAGTRALTAEQANIQAARDNVRFFPDGE